jgi:NEDD8-activating enzyme E1 regulatory subunit
LTQLFSYRQKARKDVAVVQDRVRKILSSIGRPIDSISSEEIENFSKNATFIEVIRYRSLQEEYISDPKKADISKLHIYNVSYRFKLQTF